MSKGANHVRSFCSAHAPGIQVRGTDLDAARQAASCTGASQGQMGRVVKGAAHDILPMALHRTRGVALAC
jgi:hypothetical protein